VFYRIYALLLRHVWKAEILQEKYKNRKISRIPNRALKVCNNRMNHSMHPRF